MRGRFLIFFVILAVNLSCSENEEVGYYKNGSIKYRVPLMNDKYEGEMVVFYPDGGIKAKILYSEGKKSGFQKAYSTAGNLLNEIEFSGTRKHGTFKTFFQNGQLKASLKYYNDTINGLGMDYYENASIYKIYYTDMGKPIYLKGYDSLGNINQSMVTAEVMPVDSLNTNNFGDFHRMMIGIKYSYGDENRVGVIIGNLDKSGILQDTIQMIGSKSGSLHVGYQIKPSQKGKNQVSGVVYEIKMPEEEIIGEDAFTYSYYVD